MSIAEDVLLAPFTTFKIGGPARVFIESYTEGDVDAARDEAARRALPLLPLRGGSNILVPDEGVEGLVLKIAFRDLMLEKDRDTTLLVAGAGLSWNDAVDAACAPGVFGIENLAGIPGTIGGAVVQNIGAYGAELADVFEYADTVDGATGARTRIDRAHAAFGYRTSFFKEHRTHIITRVVLRLHKRASPNIGYADLAQAQEAGVPLETSAQVAHAIRAIRARKFPRDSEGGTAGSFFKNPIISPERAETLAARYAGMPVFPQENGDVKVSLAWLLDHALALRGYAVGRARLYERQPLVIVACAGATAAEIETLARDVEERVFVATGITLEREVERFGLRK
ncbi:MAG: UDP-N-acetylmuramate dehydrogenase [Patescibacteria group bacterium]|nr:UDP-N-acetylmuramate dehydrogenase [Patescibacteria group bacterium]